MNRSTLRKVKIFDMIVVNNQFNHLIDAIACAMSPVCRGFDSRLALGAVDVLRRENRLQSLPQTNE